MSGKRIQTDLFEELLGTQWYFTSDLQTAFALAISFGLYNSEEQVQYGSNRVSEIVRKNNLKISIGFEGISFLTLVLAQTVFKEYSVRYLIVCQFAHLWCTGLSFSAQRLISSHFDT